MRGGRTPQTESSLYGGRRKLRVEAKGNGITQNPPQRSKAEHANRQTQAERHKERLRDRQTRKEANSRQPGKLLLKRKMNIRTSKQTSM